MKSYKVFNEDEIKKLAKLFEVLVKIDQKAKKTHITNIYLDIDGVLLVNDNNPANFADSFIKYVVTNYPTYWLTTHCRRKENYAVELLSRFFSGETLEYLQQIRPTDWDINKTEAIDFSKPFLWFDDDLYEGEKQELIKHNMLDNWIEVDFRKDENMLGKFLSSFPIPIQEVRNEI